MTTELIDDGDGADALFSVVLFLNVEQEREDRWRREHFSDGSKRYEYRTRDDKLNNCRKSYGVGVNESGVLYIKREHPCRIYTGDDPCQDCLDRRRLRRRKDFSGRIDSIANSGVGLHAMVTTNQAEQRLIASRCRYHGYDFMSVPTGNEQERYTVINGPIKGSDPVSHDTARRRVSELSSVLFADRSQRISGKLGKSDEAGDDTRFGGNIVALFARDILYGSRSPGQVEIGIANVKIAKRMAAIDGGGKITADTAQEFLTNRENESLNVLRSMGFPCYFSLPKETKFNLDAMKDQWISIKEAQYEVIGSIESVDNLTKMLMKITVDLQNGDISAQDFDASVDAVAGRTLSLEAPV